MPGYKEFIPVARITKVGINYGLFDRLFRVANISISIKNQSSSGRKFNKYFYSIPDYYEFVSAAKHLLKDDQLYVEEYWNR